MATMRMLGTFLPDPLDVPWSLVTFLTDQLSVVGPSAVKAYAGPSAGGRAPAPCAGDHHSLL